MKKLLALSLNLLLCLASNAQVATQNNEVNVMSFGAKGDGVTDDTGPIQNAINSIPVSKTGYLVFPTGTYAIKSLVLGNRVLNIDGKGSTLLCSGQDSIAILIINTTKMSNLNIAKTHESNTKVALNISGTRSNFDNIQVSGVFSTIFDCYGLKESHFSHIRADNDVKNYTGNIFRLNYCVNSSISQSMIGFCENAFFFTTQQDPQNRNKSEGILISDCITVYANKAARIDWGTQISLIGNVLDFCRDYGIFQTLGQSLVAQGNWIAARGVDGFIGIGCTKNLTGGSIIGNQIYSGGVVVKGTALSITGKSIGVSGNYFSDLQGGVVTDPTSSVYGNTFAGTSASPISASNTKLSIDGQGIEQSYNLAASYGANITSTSSQSVTISPSNRTYNLTGTSNVTVTLPPVASCFLPNGQNNSTLEFVVKIASASNITVTLKSNQANSSATIDGQTQFSFSGPYQSKVLYTDGQNWFTH